MDELMCYLFMSRIYLYGLETKWMNQCCSNLYCLMKTKWMKTQLDLFEEIPVVMMCKYKFSIAILAWAIRLPYILKQVPQLNKEDDVGNLGLGHYIWSSKINSAIIVPTTLCSLYILSSKNYGI